MYKKVQTGDFDADILCPKCDGYIGEFDRYGKQILVDYDWDRATADSALAPYGVAIADFDYRRLKVFFLSVVWRMHISARPANRAVQIGPFAASLKSLVKRGDAGGIDDFSVVLTRFRGPARVNPILDPKSVIIQSWCTKVDGINAVRLNLGQYSGWVKVDSRPFVDANQRLCMGPGRPLFVALRDFDRSPELRAMWEQVRKIG